jgi:GT2 family glycosyltransferase
VSNRPAPKVVAAVLNWNGYGDTVDCVNSLRAQTIAGLQIVVVDNGSSSQEGERLALRFPEIEVILSKSNLGFCGGNNLAIDAATRRHAEYVLFVNNDAVLPPTAVETLISEVENLDCVGAASPLIVDARSGAIWFGGATWDSSAAFFRYAYSGSDIQSVVERSPYQTDHACGCCMLVPMSVVGVVGPMADRYFAFYDEAEWASRMRKHDLRCYVVPTATAIHKVSQSTPTPVSLFLLSRNRMHWMRETLSRPERRLPYKVIALEFAWHFCRMIGLPLRNSGLHSRAESEAVVLGILCGIARRWGRWPRRIESLS